MKIRNKLTLIFTIMVALIIICLNVYIFILFRSFTKNSFYNQLRDRTLAAANVFLEKDESSTLIMKSFQRRYLRTLPREIIRVYNDKNIPVFVDSSDISSFSESLINEVRKREYYQMEEDGRQLVGIHYEDNEGAFVIIASAYDERGAHNLRRLLEVMIAGFVICIIIVFFTGRYFTKLILHPVSLISERAKEISESNLHLRLDEGNGQDELAELSTTINHMLKRLEDAFELQKSFVNNASHELRTPLTSIIGNIEVTLAKARTPDDYKLVLEQVLLEAEKLHSLTNGLLNLAQSNIEFSHFIKEDIRLDELLIETNDQVRANRTGSDILLAFPEMPEDPSILVIPGDRKLLGIALLNIIDNACKFSAPDAVQTSLLIGDKNILIRVQDRGIGIAADELPFISETFYRGSNARAYHGSGIGLSLSDKIIRLHGGSLSVHSVLNEGTTVEISFPLSRP